MDTGSHILEILKILGDTNLKNVNLFIQIIPLYFTRVTF